MKTAVSLPDPNWQAEESSQLHAEAIAEYLARHAPDDVTEAVNRVMDEVPKPAWLMRLQLML